MNIFFLDETPEKSAKFLCDKHVPKMLLESAQMLSTAVQKYTDRIEELYKPAYPNHPMTKWVGFNRDCFRWALENAMSISQEYCKRFKKLHKSSKIISTTFTVSLATNKAQPIQVESNININNNITKNLYIIFFPKYKA